jgi:hypothetical protein
MNAEAACDVGAGVTAYLNQHWIPREPPSSCRCACPRRFRRYGKALKQAQGTHLFVGVQGLALHGEVDFLRYNFKI